MTFRDSNYYLVKHMKLKISAVNRNKQTVSFIGILSMDVLVTCGCVYEVKIKSISKK